MKQAPALYMPPQVLRPDFSTEGAKCGSCIMFDPATSKCDILSPAEVSKETGVCGLYIGGTKEHHVPVAAIPADVAGYIDSGAPTKCGTCVYFLGAALRECKIVEGDISPFGCCNFWEGM